MLEWDACSPYAALDFTAVNPELAEFDLKGLRLTVLNLWDEIHKRDGKLFIDIAINQDGPQKFMKLIQTGCIDTKMRIHQPMLGAPFGKT